LNIVYKKSLNYLISPSSLAPSWYGANKKLNPACSTLSISSRRRTHQHQLSQLNQPCQFQCFNYTLLCLLRLNWHIVYQGRATSVVCENRLTTLTLEVTLISMCNSLAELFFGRRACDTWNMTIFYIIPYIIGAVKSATTLVAMNRGWWSVGLEPKE
jgi:hypothetical protein